MEAIIPATPSGAMQKHRDVGPDKWGFIFRQFSDGTIVILNAPVEGVLGTWIPGSRGGPLEGRTLVPGDPLWSRVSAQIGEHPDQAKLRSYVRGMNYGDSRFTQTLLDITSGFTADPSGEAGRATSQVVEALPGIQGTIYQLTTPSTLEGMSKKLGHLKGELAVTRDPVRRAQLEEQIKAYEFRISILMGQMQSSGMVPAATPTAIPWWPFAILGALAIAGGALVYSGKRRQNPRRRLRRAA